MRLAGLNMLGTDAGNRLLPDAPLRTMARQRMPEPCQCCLLGART